MTTGVRPYNYRMSVSMSKTYDNLLLTFVHLGERVPRYLIVNVARCKRLFPFLEILLIGDSERTRLLAVKLGVVYLNYDKHAQQARIGLTFTDLEHDKQFWDGYHQKTFDRLLTLEEAHHHFPEAILLHIESDVILFSDFPFDRYLNFDKLAWCQHDELSDVASILFSPNLSHSKLLASELAQLAREHTETSDMGALNTIRKMDNGMHVRLLPRFYTDQEFSGEANDAKGGINFLFDGAQFGQWILGWDPRSRWGLGRNRFWSPKESNPLEDYSIDLDAKGVKIEVNGHHYRLANLHVHSKRISAFLEDDNRSLGVAVAKLKSPSIRYYFSPSGFLKSLVSKTTRWSRSIWSLGAWKRMLIQMRQD